MSSSILCNILTPVFYGMKFKNFDKVALAGAVSSDKDIQGTEFEIDKLLYRFEAFDCQFVEFFSHISIFHVGFGVDEAEFFLVDVLFGTE